MKADGFKVIAKPDKPTRSVVHLAPDVLALLRVRQQALSEALGFTLTLSQTIGYATKHAPRLSALLKHANDVAEPAYPVTPTKQWPTSTGPVPYDDDLVREIRDIACDVPGTRMGNKILGIKYAREKTGMGLKDAKDFVEAIMDGSIY